MRSRFALLATFAIAATCSTPAAGAPPTIEMTWMSIANWYFKVGDKRILMDGYVTRVPESLFVASPVFPKDMYTFTKAPYGVDVPASAFDLDKDITRCRRRGGIDQRRRGLRRRASRH